MNCHQKGNKKLPITHYYSYVLSEVFVELWAFENVFSDYCPGNLRHSRTFFHLQAAMKPQGNRRFLYVVFTHFLTMKVIFQINELENSQFLTIMVL